MSKRKGVLLTAVVAALLLLTVSVLVACEEEPTTFTVTLRSGFDDAVITETVEEGTSFTLPENTFVRPGYEFTGWTREGSTFLLAPGASSPIYADAVYVANWREEGSGTGGEESFTVVLKFSDDPDASTDRYSGIAEGTSFTLPDCVWLNPGYTFAGWLVDGVSMSPGDEITVNGNMEIVAVWNAVSDPGPTEEIYTVTYLDGYSDGMRNVSVSESDGAIYTLPELFEDFARTDKKFVGWQPDNSSDVLSPGAAYPVTSDLTFTAVWEDYTYTVTFMSDDSVVSETEGISSGSFVYAPAAPDKTGYEFKGWKNISAPETVYQPGAAINVSGDLTFEAVWEILTYEVRFEISVQTAFAKITLQEETVTVEYGAIPESSLNIPESYNIDYETMASFSGSWTPEVTAATADAVYSAEYTITDRLYPVEFIQNGYVFFEVDGEIVTEYGVKYRTDLEFKLVRSPGVYIDNVTVLANDELVSADPNGVYTLAWSADSIVSAANWEFAEYEIAVSASNAQYEISQTTGLHYGDIITLTAWGDEWYNAGAPDVVLDGENLSPIAENEGKYVYEITATRNSSLEISGVITVVPITFVDIYNNEYSMDWTIDQGWIGFKLPDGIATNIQFGADTYLVYKYFLDNPASYDINYFVFSYTTERINANNIVSTEAEAEQNCIDRVNQYDAQENSMYPQIGGENKYYLLYYLKETGSYTLDIVVPQSTQNISYFIEGESDDWCSLYQIYGATSAGHLGVAHFDYQFIDYDGSIGQSEKKFSPNNVVYVKIELPEGEVLPILYHAKDNALVLTPDYYDIQVGNQLQENVYCYRIVTNYANMEYLPLDDSDYIYDISFNCDVKTAQYIIYENDGTNLGSTMRATPTLARENDSFTFKIAYSYSYVDFAAMIVEEAGVYQPNMQLFDIIGSYDEISYTVDSSDSSTGYIYVTVTGIKSDIIISNLNYQDATPEIPLLIGDYYDYYVDGVLVEGEVGTIVRVPIVGGSVIEMRLHDDIPYNFVQVNVNKDNPNLGSIRVYWQYYNSNNVATDNYGWGATLSEDGRSITDEFSTSDVKSKSNFTDEPFRFLYFELGYKAENVTDKCAGYGSSATLTVLEDLDRIEGLDQDTGAKNMHAYPYVDYQNGFMLEVVAPYGTVPVLYVERADMLSDSFRKYYASDKKLQEGEQYMYVYTFTLTDIDSEIRWYLGTEAEVYDITFVYGDSSVIIPVEYGTSINDIADVPTYYVMAEDGGQTFYMITAWMNGDTEVSVIDGSVTTLHATGTATSATVSFSYSGGVEFFDNLAAALASDIVKNNSGTLDMFYGKTDNSLTEGTYTIPAGVTLRLPYAVGSYGRAYGVTGADGNSPSVFFADESDGFTSVVIGAGATLEVYGSVSVGGIVGYPASAMPYQGQTSAAHAVLELDGTMNVYSGGRLYVNGYIEGSGTVELETGAASYLPFVVKDYRGGTNSSNVYMEDIAPFNIYEMPNIQTTYIINYGASEYAYAMLYAMNTFNETVAQVIGSDGMIRLSASGYVEKKTTRIENPRNETGTDTSVEPAYEHRTTLDIYGGGSDGVLSLSILGLVTVTTGDVYMGIPYTYERITLHDGDYTIYNMFKIMPGSTLEVASGATLEILAGASIAVYEEGFKETSSQLNNRQQLTYPAEPNGYAEGGKLALGGTLTITGTFGGEITAEDASGTPTIVVNTSSNASLSVEAVEAVQLNNAEFEYTYQATLIAMAGETQLAPCPPGAPVTYLYSDGVWAIS